MTDIVERLKAEGSLLNQEAAEKIEYLREKVLSADSQISELMKTIQSASNQAQYLMDKCEYAEDRYYALKKKFDGMRLKLNKVKHYQKVENILSRLVEAGKAQ